MSLTQVFLSLLTLTRALKYEITKTVNSDSSVTLDRCLVYSRADAIGNLNPEISLSFISDSSALKNDSLVILNSKDYEYLEVMDFCTSPSKTMHLNVTSTDVYSIVYSRCDNSSVQVGVDLEVVNPFGYLPGELFMLLPVLFT